MGPTQQSWLFREGDLILGPVTSQQIIDKLYGGDLFPHTEVQLVGSDRFKKLSEFPEFKVHVAKSEAKRRVEAHALEHQSKLRKKLKRTLAIGLGVLVVLGVGVAVFGSYLAVHGWDFWRKSDGLQISIDAPTISVAKRQSDDELVDYQGSGKRPSTAPVGGRPLVGSAPSAPPRPPPGAKPGMGSAEPDGMEMDEGDEAGINAVVTKSKASLIPCIKTVAKPGIFLKIPIEFSIAEAGKVSRVWVDNPELKGSGIEECLLKELKKWPFKPTHSGRSVSISYNVGKKD